MIEISATVGNTLDYEQMDNIKVIATYILLLSAMGFGMLIDKVIKRYGRKQQA